MTAPSGTQGIRRLVFDALAVFAIGIAFYLLINDTSKAAVKRTMVAGGISLICALIGNLDRIERLKASWSGVEAKMLEIKDVLEDAKASVASLHQLATTTGAFLVSAIAESGRLSGSETPRRKDAAKQDLIERLKAMGLGEEAIAEVSQGDALFVRFDYLIGIFGRLCSGPDRDSVATEDRAALTQLLTEGSPPSAERCKQLSKRFLLNAFEIELLEDYAYYERNHKHRRPEVWADRGNWRLRNAVESDAAASD